MDKRLISLYMASKNIKHENCLVNECPQKAIRAHSIQKSNILDLLCVDDHVIGISETHDKIMGPLFNFNRIGRHEASTFQGLCNKHDTDIFLPIEGSITNYESPEQLFLISYRAILRELHTKICVAKQINYVINKLKQMEAPNNQIKEAQILEKTFLSDSYDEYNNKIRYDFIHHYREYDYCLHKIIRVATEYPTIAASSVISVEPRKISDYARATISVLPISTHETIIVYSFLEKYSTQAKLFFENTLKNGSLDEFSSFVINRCENLFFSQKLIDVLSISEKEQILNLFSPIQHNTQKAKCNFSLFATRS